LDSARQVITPNCYVVRDADGQQIAYIYYKSDPGRRSAAKLLTDEARRIVSWGCEHPRKKAAKAALVFEDWNGPTSSQKAVPEANRAC
jgi:hypothetical protein